MVEQYLRSVSAPGAAESGALAMTLLSLEYGALALAAGA
jgi:hypothetical protein